MYILLKTLIVLYGGSFDRCEIRLPASESTPEVNFDCKLDDDVIQTSNTNIGGLTLHWTAKWELPPDTPITPSYVVDRKMGIISTFVNLQLINSSKSLSVLSYPFQSPPRSLPWQEDFNQQKKEVKRCICNSFVFKEENSWKT